MSSTLDERVGAVPGDEGAERPMRKDAARNRQLLIEAAREVFARRGLDASLDDIAKQAGVGVGTAYRHFGNKLELARAVMDDTVADVIATAERAASCDDPWAGLLDFLETVLALQVRDRGLRAAMAGGYDPKDSDEVHERLSKPVRTMLERAQRSGAVRAEVEVSDLGFVLSMLCQVSDVAGDIDDQLWRRYLPALLAALRPDGPPLPGRPLPEEQFHTASAEYWRCKPRGGELAGGCGGVSADAATLI